MIAIAITIPFLCVCSGSLLMLGWSAVEVQPPPVQEVELPAEVDELEEMPPGEITG